MISTGLIWPNLTRPMLAGALRRPREHITAASYTIKYCPLVSLCTYGPENYPSHTCVWSTTYLTFSCSIITLCRSSLSLQDTSVPRLRDLRDPILGFRCFLYYRFRTSPKWNNSDIFTFPRGRPISLYHHIPKIYMISLDWDLNGDRNQRNDWDILQWSIVPWKRFELKGDTKLPSCNLLNL